MSVWLYWLFFSFTNELFEFKLDKNCPLSNLFFDVALKFKMPALVVHSLKKERIGGKYFL